MNGQQFIFVAFGSMSLVVYGMMGAMILFERSRKRAAKEEESQRQSAEEQPRFHLHGLRQHLADHVRRHGLRHANRGVPEEAPSPYRGTGISPTIR